MKYNLLLVPLGLVFILPACRQPATSDTELSLKDLYKSDFTLGVAVNAAQISGTDRSAQNLIVRHFGTVTPENAMKAEKIHPSFGRYNFSAADSLVNFAMQHRLRVNGHTLIWHSQLPAFVKNIRSRDSLKTFFEDHIQQVASRYRGKVSSWDVVNEALNEDGSMRKSVFYEKIGPGYVTSAFRLAAAASPGTELYYNDYNIEKPEKRAGAIQIVKEIQRAGLRIDGVGIQGHWNIENVPYRQIEDAIVQFASLGLKVAITELDISVLPNPLKDAGADISLRADFRKTLDPYKEGLPDSVQQHLAVAYEKLFRIFLKHRDKISRVTWWGLSDRDSWLNNWPVPGRTNYPLLFDRELRKKAAFMRVYNLKKLPGEGR